MNQASRGSRVVFVGNIPFELSEEQLIEVFKEVGPVASFRLLFDRETGRPKGYGFCEFYDAETAASAVRNLNDYEIGGRQLRVDYAAMDDNHQRPNHQNNQNRHHHPPPQGPPLHQQQMQMQQQQMPMQPPMQPSMQAPMQPSMQPAMQPPMQPVMQPPMQPAMQPPMQAMQPIMQPSAPANKPPVGNVSSVDEISKVLASMNSQDLFTLMSQMKQMSFERPDFTREFLAANPQVAYALFQAMLMMNIVDPNIITRIMTGNPAPVSQPPPVQPVLQQPQPIQPIRAPIINSPIPPVPAPIQAPPPSQPDMALDDTEQQKALLMKVLQLTDDQINELPPQTRDQIRQLKAQLTMQQQ